MKKSNRQSKQFITYFTVCSVGILGFIALFIYLIDPFFQYRIRDKQYILNPIYNNPGIAKHADYNTVIIGSSMVQNYNLGTLRKDGKTKPIKLASGAMTTIETTFLFDETNKETTDTYIINIDIIQFNEWLPAFRYPKYLFEGGILNRLQYHFAYESVVRYALTDAILYPYLATTDENNIPDKLKVRYSVDQIGNFSLDAIYNDVDRIKDMYRKDQTVSTPQIFNMSDRIENNINKLFERLQVEKYNDKQFIFVLPAYSALYWHIAKRDEYYDNLMNGIRHLCLQTEKYSNVSIQFFYTLDQITDLSKYSDVTHFDPATSDYILDNLKNKDYTISIDNMENKINQLDSIVTNFQKANQDWL